MNILAVWTSLSVKVHLWGTSWKKWFRCWLFYAGRKASQSWSRLRWVLLPPQHLHAAIPPPLLAVPHFPTVSWPLFYLFFLLSPQTFLFFLAIIFWLWSQVPRHTNFSTQCSHMSYDIETDGAQAFISIFFSCFSLMFSCGVTAASSEFPAIYWAAAPPFSSSSSF